jgi:predicted DNA-binding transcriptional regulator YafY
MANTATRLITLILLLQNRPNQKASDLAGKLGVSIRTIHRYFLMLDEMGMPVYSERGPHGGFSLVRGYKLPPLIFSPDEAVAVYLGTSLVGEMWGQFYQVAAQGAMAKLENIMPNEQLTEIEWARRSMIATGLHRINPASVYSILEVLRQAAREQQRVHLTYQGGISKGVTNRKIDPYALVLRAGLWYLVGYCHLRKAPRTFRVDRIQELKSLNQSFNLPEEFDIREYLDKEFKEQSGIQARLLFNPEAAHIVTSNRYIWDSVEEKNDGSIQVTLAAPDLAWLASMTLGFANLVTVLEPPELRIMVRELAQAIVEQYRSNTPAKRSEK